MATKKKRNKPYRPMVDTSKWMITSTIMFKRNPDQEREMQFQIHYGLNQLELCRGTLLNVYDVYLRILSLALASEEFNEADEVYDVATRAVDTLEAWLADVKPVLGRQEVPLPLQSAEVLRLAVVYAEAADAVLPRRTQYLLAKKAGDVLTRHPLLGRHVPWS